MDGISVSFEISPNSEPRSSSLALMVSNTLPSGTLESRVIELIMGGIK